MAAAVLPFFLLWQLFMQLFDLFMLVSCTLMSEKLQSLVERDMVFAGSVAGLSLLAKTSCL
jgi:hypothetical protein